MINYDTEGQGVSSGGLSNEQERDLNRGDGSTFVLDLSNGARFQYSTFVERDDGNRPYYSVHAAGVQSLLPQAVRNAGLG